MEEYRPVGRLYLAIRQWSCGWRGSVCVRHYYPGGPDTLESGSADAGRPFLRKRVPNVDGPTDNLPTIAIRIDACQHPRPRHTESRPESRPYQTAEFV